MSLLLTQRPTIVDRFVPRSLTADIALIAAGSLLTAFAAQISIPTLPVPITGQTFAVLLVASALGMARGSISMILYAALGAVGLPVFTGAANLATKLAAGPVTLGYLAGFIAAAALVGFLAQQGFDKNPLGVIASFIAGNLVIYAFGVTWLAFVMNIDFVTAINFGTTPFLLGDAIKIALAAAALPLAWAGVKRIRK